MLLLIKMLSENSLYKFKLSFFDDLLVCHLVQMASFNGWDHILV